MVSVTSVGTGVDGAFPTANNGDPSDLGQDDFLAILTAQLQNQDPFQPMENAEFLGQMAQFSTVSGIESLNETMQEISTGLAGGRLTDAAVMIGRAALVPGTNARPDPGGAIRGAATLSDAASAVTVRYSDPVTFETLHEQELGAQPAGQLDIVWDAPPASIADGRQPVRITVMAEGSATVEPYVYAQIEAVRMPDTANGGLIFTVEDYGLFSELEIDSLR